jgi:benzoate transport
MTVAASVSTEDPREIIAREPMHLRQVLAIGIATALNALDGFDVLSISFASPGIAAQWGIDRAELGVVLSMELIGMAIGAFTLGTMADRAGRRPTTLLCLAIMATGMALAAVSTSVVMLSLVRLLTGLGIGGMLAATNAIVAECANARRRNLSVAIMAGGFPLGAIVGGTIASMLLAATGSWQAIFVFGALTTAAFIPLVFWFVPETIAFLCDRRPKGALDRINRTMRRQGRAALAALPPAPDSGPRAGIAEAFAPGMARVTLLLTLAYFFHIMTFYFLMKWIPKEVADMGFAPSLAGGVLVWANVGGALGSLGLSFLTQWVDVRRLVIGAMIAGALAVAGFGQARGGLSGLCIAAAIAGFFTNGATAGLYAVFAQSFPTRLRAGGTGIVIGIGRGGAALGPIVAGLLFAFGWPLAWVAAAMACGCVVGAAMLGLLRHTQRDGP